MKTLLARLFLALSVLAAPAFAAELSAQDVAALNAVIDQSNAAFARSDAPGIADTTSERLLEAVGGREKYVESIHAGMKAVQAQGISRRPLTGDVDCDGHADAISYAVSSDAVRVEVRFNQKGRAAQALSFSIGAGSQDSLHAKPAEVRLESLDFDPKGEAMGALPGFQRSGICKGIVLDDQQSDPIHVYWDHDTHQPAWWRY